MEMEQTFRRFQVVEPSCFSCFFRIGRGAAGYSDVLYLPQGEDHKKRRTSAAFFRWGRVGCVQHSCNTPVSHDKAVTIRLMWPFVVLQRKECSSSVTGNWILKKNEGEEEALLWRLMGQRFCTRVLASPFFKACNYCNMSGEQHVFQKIDVNQSAWKSCPPSSSLDMAFSRHRTSPADIIFHSSLNTPLSSQGLLVPIGWQFLLVLLYFKNNVRHC